MTVQALDMQEEFALEVAAFRRVNHLSQNQLARTLGWDRRAVSNIERGKGSARFVEKLKEFMAEAKIPEEPAPETTAKHREPKPEPEESELVKLWHKNAKSERMTGPIRITKVVTHDTEDRVSITGVLDPESKIHLKVGPYQREELRTKTVQRYVADYKEGNTMPDIILGMRGSDCEVQRGVAVLNHKVYIIDGQQRVRGAFGSEEVNGIVPHLSVRVFLNTDEAWERQKFIDYNTKQSKPSPNVVLREMRFQNHFIGLLYDLSFDPEFALGGRVQWDHYMHKDELIAALGMVKVYSRLFHRFQPGLLTQNYRPIAAMLAEVLKKLGKKTMRDIMMTYWNIVDDAFNVRNVIYKIDNVQCHQGMNIGFARLLGECRNFWRGNELRMPLDLRSRLRAFNLSDPHFRKMCQQAIMGGSSDFIRDKFKEHLNHGRTEKNRLHRFSEE